MSDKVNPLDAEIARDLTICCIETHKEITLGKEPTAIGQDVAMIYNTILENISR